MPIASLPSTFASSSADHYGSLMHRTTRNRISNRPAATAAVAFCTLAAFALSVVSASAQDAVGSSIARSPDGMVVTGSPIASAVGARVLRDGGNAIDAAVAAAFALSVVEPTMSGLGGRTQILLRLANGHVAAVDGTTEVPASYRGGPTADDDAYGIATIAVPGTVAALAEALAAHGTWPLDRVIAPAESLALHGFTLPAPEAARIANAAARLSEFEG
jgi:gamma-glutamyltranspeptidase/glutathione hydrolase